MSETIEFPTDEDGFISRECPTCFGQFKAPVINGNSTVHFCPYCGHEGEDCWWTPDQVDMIQKATAAMILPTLEEMVKEFEAQSSGFIKLKAELSPPEPVIAPREDILPMDTVSFPCCSSLLKIDLGRLSSPQGDASSAFCILCGTPSAVS